MLLSRYEKLKRSQKVVSFSDSETGQRVTANGSGDHRGNDRPSEAQSVEMEALRSKVAALEARNASLQQTAAAALRSTSTANNPNGDRTLRGAASSDSSEALKAQVVQWKRKVKALAIKLKGVQQERDAAVGEADLAKQRIAAAEAEAAQLRSSRSPSPRANTSGSNGDAQEALLRAQSDYEALSRENLALVERHMGLQTRNQRLIAARDAAQAQADQMAVRLEETRQALEAAEARVGQETEAATVQRRLEGRIAALTAELGEYDTALDRARNAVQAAESEAASAVAATAARDDDLATAQATVAGLKDELRDALRENDRLTRLHHTDLERIRKLEEQAHVSAHMYDSLFEGAAGGGVLHF